MMNSGAANEDTSSDDDEKADDTKEEDNEESKNDDSDEDSSDEITATSGKAPKPVDIFAGVKENIKKVKTKFDDLNSFREIGGVEVGVTWENGGFWGPETAYFITFKGSFDCIDETMCGAAVDCHTQAMTNSTIDRLNEHKDTDDCGDDMRPHPDGSNPCDQISGSNIIFFKIFEHID